MPTSKFIRLVKLISVFATVLLVALVGVIIFQYAKLSSQEADSKSLNQKIVELNQRRESLEDGIDYRKSDTYVEFYAREELGMIKEGETLYKVIEK